MQLRILLLTWGGLRGFCPQVWLINLPLPLSLVSLGGPLRIARSKECTLTRVFDSCSPVASRKDQPVFFSRCCEWVGESLPLILTDVVCHLFSGLLQSGDCRWVIKEVMAKAVSICLLRALPNSASPPSPLRKGSPLLLSTPKPIAHFPEFRKTKSVMCSWIPQAWISPLCRAGRAVACPLPAMGKR